MYHLKQISEKLNVKEIRKKTQVVSFDRYTKLTYHSIVYFVLTTKKDVLHLVGDDYLNEISDMHDLIVRVISKYIYR